MDWRLVHDPEQKRQLLAIEVAKAIHGAVAMGMAMNMEGISVTVDRNGGLGIGKLPIALPESIATVPLGGSPAFRKFAVSLSAVKRDAPKSEMDRIAGAADAAFDEIALLILQAIHGELYVQQISADQAKLTELLCHDIMIILPVALLGTKEFSSKAEVEAGGEVVAFRVGYLLGLCNALTRIRAIQLGLDHLPDRVQSHIAYTLAVGTGWQIFGFDVEDDADAARFEGLISKCVGIAGDKGLKIGFQDMKNFENPDHFSFSWRLAVPELRAAGLLKEDDWRDE
jgi:hypothetical protein